MVTLLAQTLPIDLETLDPQGNVIASVAASLQHLDGEMAYLHIPIEEPMSGLQWGARVRFWVEDGPRGYEVTGGVAGYQEEESEDPERAYREIRVRLWECRLAPQRRSTPRRRGRFAVQYLPLGFTDIAPAAEDGAWQRGWCVDIGGGGMRLRLPQGATVPERLALRFTLPKGRETRTVSSRREFDVLGIVLRQSASGNRDGSLELAIKFQRLSIEDGLALSAFLCE
jgi:hypothetical protein